MGGRADGLGVQDLGRLRVVEDFKAARARVDRHHPFAQQRRLVVLPLGGALMAG